MRADIDFRAGVRVRHSTPEVASHSSVCILERAVWQLSTSLFFAINFLEYCRGAFFSSEAGNRT